MKLCPTCGQNVEPSRRVCAICHFPILRHHKFVFEGSSVRHRVCAEPMKSVPTMPTEQTAIELGGDK